MPPKAKSSARTRKSAKSNAKRKPSSKAHGQTPGPATAQPATSPVRLFVRRGAEQRFQKLKEKTAALDVVVAWDRREGERRSSAGPVSGERRKQDRRKQPTFTWDLADFAVVVSSASKE